MRLLITAISLLATVALLGCSDDGGGEEAAAEIPGGADPESARVIDEWSTALREGDVEAAADYFEVPSIAQNGTPPLELSSREDVIAFNEALPCGAELIEAEAEENEITVATFELTERPGPGKCRTGTGNTAQTAFIIEEGLIVEWRRVADDSAVDPSSTAPIV